MLVKQCDREVADFKKRVWRKWESKTVFTQRVKTTSRYTHKSLIQTHVPSKVQLAPVHHHGFNSKALVQYLQKDLVVDGVECRAEVQKDDSTDVTRVYRFDDLVMHGDDGGLGRVIQYQTCRFCQKSSSEQ